jgi:uroporphyrinogen-III decarboxylase
MKPKPEMTPRERLLAALRREPTDRVPCAPLIDGYFQFSLPGGRERRLPDIAAELDVDLIMRHVLTYGSSTPAFIGMPFKGTPTPGIEPRWSRDGDDIVGVFETPVGALRQRLRFAPESPYIPWPVEWRLKSLEDVKVYQFMVERTSFELSPEAFLSVDAMIGERGIATTDGPTSPIQNMINLEMGLERLVYLLSDYPREMEEFLETLHQKNLEAYRLLADGPAQIVIAYENTSTTTISRQMYSRFDRRYTNEYADILHEGGKTFITHMCGSLSGFAKHFAGAHQDGISDVTPSPTGDLDIVEARRTWARRFVLVGGIDPTLFARGTAEEMDAYVSDLLERMGPDRRGFILGSGDAVPYGTPPENLRTAAAASARFPVN